MNVVFSTASESIVVCQSMDGSVSWSGKYNGVPILQALPIQGGQYCVILLDQDAVQHIAFHNLICINRQGDVVWIAKLPTSPDVFVNATSTDAGILATTFSGYSILLDKDTGAQLQVAFVK